MPESCLKMKRLTALFPIQAIATQFRFINLQQSYCLSQRLVGLFFYPLHTVYTRSTSIDGARKEEEDS